MSTGLGATIGDACVGRFDPDFMQRKWRAKQLEVCEELGIEPSNTVIFGLGGPEYSAYSRGGIVNRLCLNDYYESQAGAASQRTGSVSGGH